MCRVAHRLRSTKKLQAASHEPDHELELDESTSVQKKRPSKAGDPSASKVRKIEEEAAKKQLARLSRAMAAKLRRTAGSEPDCYVDRLLQQARSCILRKWKWTTR